MYETNIDLGSRKWKCSPRIPRFASSNFTLADGFFLEGKSSEHRYFWEEF